MAHSSPAQDRSFNLVNADPVAGHLSDSVEDVVHHDGVAEVPYQQVGMEPFLDPEQPLDVAGESRHRASPEVAVTCRAAEESMLLDKPSSLSRPPDLEKGYQFGPAVRLAPDHFTKIPGMSTVVHPGNSIQRPEDDSTRPAFQDAHYSRLQTSSLRGGHGKETASIVSLPPTSAGLSAARPETARKGQVEKIDTCVYESLETVRGLHTTAKPPFPVSPEKASSLRIHSRSTQEVNKSVASESGNPTGGRPTPGDKPAASEPIIDEVHHPCIPHGRHLETARPRQASMHDERVSQDWSEQEKQPHMCPNPPAVRASRHSGRESADQTPSQMPTRPMRGVVTATSTKQTHRARPHSRSSNVSKPRSICGSLSSSPMLRQRRVNISHDFTTGLAGVINQFTQQQNAALEEQKAKYKKYIKQLKRDLGEEAGVIARQVSQLDAQKSVLKTLEASKERLESQLAGMEAKLRTSEDRARRLEEKYRVCKDHLNAAIQEQQDLYTRSKKYWGEAIDQMRAMEKAQHAETEMAVRKAEVIREEMMEKVRQAIAQNKSEALELYEKIDLLAQQAKEKDAELAVERESVRTLSKELQDQQATSSSFETLAAQGQGNFDKLSKQLTEAGTLHRKSTEELLDGLNAIATRIEQLTKLASGQPDALASVQQAQQESWLSVDTKLNDILESRDAAKEATGQLSADLERHMGQIWQRLDQQLDSLGKELAKTAEENGMVSTLYRRKEAECEKHMKEVAELRETVDKQTEQIQDLEANLFALDAAQEENEQTIRRLEASGAETTRLKEELQSKTAAITELQNKLDAKDRDLASQLQTYSSKVCKLAETIQEKDRAACAAAQQAAETARNVVRSEMEGEKAKTMQLFEDALQERNSLAGQVEQLKRRLQEKEQNERVNLGTIRSLQESLTAEESNAKSLAQELVQRSGSLAELELRSTSRVNDLETELDATKRRVVELEGENQRQHQRSEALVAAVTQCARRSGLVVCDFDRLAENENNPEELGAAVTRFLTQLSHPQSSQTVTSEHGTQNTLPESESHKFFRNEHGRRQRTKSAEHSGSSQPDKDDDIGNVFVDNEQTEGKHAERTSGDNKSLPYTSTLHHMRRVVVRSPASVLGEPAAPSVDQEKARRRGALQPRSIMKRATRSTTSMLQQGKDPDADGRRGFKRNAQEELPVYSSAENGQGNSLVSTGVVSTTSSDLKSHSVTRASSGRPSKRRRSDTLSSNRPGQDENNSMPVKAEETSGSPARSNIEELDFNPPLSSLGIKTRGQPKSFLGKKDTLDTRPTADCKPRRNLRPSIQGLHKVPLTGSSQALTPKQPNVRTYGSQRPAGELPAAGGHLGSRLPLRSQPQSSQNRPKSGESQESISFSQNVVRDEDLGLPFPA